MGTYQWALLNPPTGSTVTFAPPITALEQPTNLSIKADSATPPGVYQSVIRATRISGTAGAPPDLPYPIHVRCSVNLNHCPDIEIVDSSQPGSPVVSAPASTQMTLIGKHMRLRVRHKPGSGSGSYMLSNAAWTIDGGTSALAKSYDIANGTLTRLSASDLGDSLVSYYYVVANTGYTVSVKAKLTRTDNQWVTNPVAMAKYDANGPTNVSMTSMTTPLGITVSPLLSDPLHSWLHLGDAGTPATAGIRFDFRASPPPGDSGYVAATQRLSLLITSDPKGVIKTTAGTYWLDGCQLYDLFTTASNSQFVWQSRDSPGVQLRSTDKSVTFQANFQMHFMYRPPGPESIWVPIGKMDWFSIGTANRTGSIADSSYGWTGPTNASSSTNPSGGQSSTFPEWTNVFQPPIPPDTCPTIPTS